MTAVQLRYPVAPAISKIRGTLLDAASVSDGGDTWMDGSDLYESFNCLPMGARASLPCPVIYIGTPVQAATSATGTGGTLPTGTYRYKVSATNAQGETLPSNEQTQAVTLGQHVVVTWAAISGATGYKVYRTAAAGAVNSEKLLKTVGAVTTYSDTGADTLGVIVPRTSSTASVLQTKEFGPLSWVDGVVFAVYGGFKCKPLGLDRAGALAGVRAAFENGEAYGVEQALLQTLFAAGTATDLTPGVDISPLTGLALLEGYMSTIYRGVPTIHIPRTVGTLLSQNGAIQTDGQTFYSKQGAKIASGGGYEDPNSDPAGATTAAGDLWIYATGEVQIIRGELVSQEAFDNVNNDLSILVERRYMASVECSIAAVKVQVY